MAHDKQVEIRWRDVKKVGYECNKHLLGAALSL
jgi:hypothetical protein